MSDEISYTTLGETGLSVSRLCLGCMSYGDSDWREWVLDAEEAYPFIERAFEAGINFFDTANMYSAGVSEEVTGRVLQDIADDREDYVLATKVYFPTGDGPNDRGLSRKHLMSAVDASLDRLGTDYIDLYYIHRWDYETPISETMRALHEIVQSGKVRYIGASSMFAWQFAKAQYTAEMHGWTQFVAMQNHYNLVYREDEREMIPLCRDQGVGLCPWSPLARGFLAGNRDQHDGETLRAQTDSFAHSMYYEEADFEVLERVEALADQRGVSPAQLALAWMLHKESIDSPIIGVTKQYQLEEALGAVDIELSDKDIAHLEEPYRPHPVLGHAPYGENMYGE